MDKIICVGKNYLAHAQELGDAVPEKPVIFLKPPSILRQAKHWDEKLLLTLPTSSSEIHYECEIVLHIKQDGYQLTIEQAASYLEEVTLGLDMTIRNLQAMLKQQGHPWTISKVFKDAAVIGPWIPVSQISDFTTQPFQFLLNNQLRQTAKIADMLFSPIELIAYVSHYFPLCAGDIIFTGTPAGVSSVKQGDVGLLQWDNYNYQVKWS